jgi:hypothetical protein
MFVYKLTKSLHIVANKIADKTHCHTLSYSSTPQSTNAGYLSGLPNKFSSTFGGGKYLRRSHSGKDFLLKEGGGEQGACLIVPCFPHHSRLGRDYTILMKTVL